ncbi:MAG: DUF6531 domain-containing protein [Thermoanaerobaculia bacterium]
MDVTLPYGVMDIYPAGLPLAVENERMPGAVTEQLPFGFLPAHLRLQTSTGAPDPRPTPNFTFKSWIATMPPELQATLRFQRGANRFESPWVVMLADPRASIRWTPAIADKAAVGCSPCERPPHIAGKTEADGVYELWAHGRTVIVRPETLIGGAYAYLGEQRRMEKRVSSVIADTVRIPDKVLASKTPPAYGAQPVNNILMHSGELVRDATDLAIKGRGLDFVFQRYYSSAVYSFGPLGRNFDSPLFARVVWLPAGGLLFYDGTGRVQRFAKDLTPEAGVFLRARNSQSGVVIAYPDNTLYSFDQYGRLAKITDRNTTKADGSDGNTINLSYNAEGRLAAVVDPVGRTVRFSYFAPTAGTTAGAYPGLLATVNDFDGRTVRYEYDAYGRLVKVTSPDPGSTQSKQQVTKYVWGSVPTSGNFRLDVLRSGQITSEIDGEERTIFTATYASSDAWRVETLAMGGGTWTYGYTDSAMTVTDPNGHARTYAFDTAGHVTSIAEPGGATTKYAFDAEGRLTSVIRPMGTQDPPHRRRDVQLRLRRERRQALDGERHDDYRGATRRLGGSCSRAHAHDDDRLRRAQSSDDDHRPRRCDDDDCPRWARQPAVRDRCRGRHNDIRVQRARPGQKSRRSAQRYFDLCLRDGRQLQEGLPQDDHHRGWSDDLCR